MLPTHKHARAVLELRQPTQSPFVATEPARLRMATHHPPPSSLPKPLTENQPARHRAA